MSKKNILLIFFSIVFNLIVFNKQINAQSSFEPLPYIEKINYPYVKEELKANPNSRRAIMIYNRPQIWNEYNIDGCNDFICTNSVAYYIRNGELHCSVSMRSNDVVYGYKNDYA